MTTTTTHYSLAAETVSALITAAAQALSTTASR